MCFFPFTCHPGILKVKWALLSVVLLVTYSSYYMANGASHSQDGNAPILHRVRSLRRASLMPIQNTSDCCLRRFQLSLSHSQLRVDLCRLHNSHHEALASEDKRTRFKQGGTFVDLYLPMTCLQLWKLTCVKSIISTP